MNEAINLSFSPILPIDSYMQTESYKIYYGMRIKIAFLPVRPHGSQAKYFSTWESLLLSVNKKIYDFILYMEPIFHLSLEL
jgi:hypothetical protein